MAKKGAWGDMIQECKRAAAQEEIDADKLRAALEEAFRRFYSMDAAMEKTANEVEEVCAECGITPAELLGLVKGCGYSVEETVREPMERAGVNAGPCRRPTGFEGKRPPMDTRPKYTPPDRTIGRKKKHGRERGRKL